MEDHGYGKLVSRAALAALTAKKIFLDILCNFFYVQHKISVTVLIFPTFLCEKQASRIIVLKCHSVHNAAKDTKMSMFQMSLFYIHNKNA